MDETQGLITFNPHYKNSSDSLMPLGNYFSSYYTGSALVCYSRTPSFPFSVHIFSPNFKNYLPSSIVELSKEIEAVGEDNSISSINLFLGNVDLPPSSYHDSLEELRDEEEEKKEIENLMEVLPCAYHQYLDEFSKVKAEKLPPHWAHDHHIKLKGSLPPSG
ncbi:hypothetical protein O181_022204 [Austropuccinia psidii MF-1]|uniref:Uncharacterized protein n=1 Tax=Austropuccinia psidii MF-1 TaxID=1389203 RepID=A0A9Q3CC69_9BASI|nr:hypothetical protein [Austropuccinia psidii MF-1]